MKLYFYMIDGFKELKLNCIEAEAEERARSYKLQKYVPGIYKLVINKNELGEPLERNNSIVILTEQDAGKAKEIFVSRIREEIEWHKKEIIRYEKEIDTINSL